MIKFSSRRNIIYIIQLTIWSSLRSLVKISLKAFYKFNKSQMYTFLVFFGEFSAGFLVHKYQSNFLKTKENKSILSKALLNIYTPKKETEEYKSNKFKIYTILFMASFFDFVEFNIISFYIVKYVNISNNNNFLFLRILIEV